MHSKHSKQRFPLLAHVLCEAFGRLRVPLFFKLIACFIQDASCKLAYQLSQVTKTKLAIAEVG